jgi:putative transcriptional regulator
MAQFHPPAELLLDYASGALAEAPSLVIATHLALCPHCREQVAQFESVGGTLLEHDCEAIPLSSQSRNEVMAALDMDPAPSATPRADALCRILPAPLRDYVGCGLSEVEWQKLTRQIERMDLGMLSGGKAQLLKIKAGAPMPAHTHKGLEYTLVLQGNFRDDSGLYRRGDLAVCDQTVAHRPVVGESEDCICLVVTQGALQFTGLLGRLLNPFVRF